MRSDYFDNKSRILKDELTQRIKDGDKISIAAAMFSMYAYRELKDQLEGLDEFRFIFTSKAFTSDRPEKQRREFYIPRLKREQGLFGTEFEIKLRNELTQKAVAIECANWIKKKAKFKSFEDDDAMANYLVINQPEDAIAYMPFNEFSTSALGTERAKNSFDFSARLDTAQSEELLKNFEQAWNSEGLIDVTESVIDSIGEMYKENAPELVYYSALFHIFNEFLDDISEDNLANDRTGFKESAIWRKLYDFQKDAVLSIINKLETYSGCILADSVGLGKTFTALAVIKYYECRNRNVLVLCPKKLKDNWLTYNSNLINNPISEDRLRYDVLYHTDLSRTKGMSETGLPFDRINWGNYDLVVIDESHNFRNGADSATHLDEGKENRYQALMRKVISDGVKTKVLMLSATPVNNRFRDLRNQLALAYSGDKSNWESKLKIDGSIEEVFKQAQLTYRRWSKLPVDMRTTNQLTEMLDFDFFEVLDQVTVARSRKHIQRYYDMKAIGPFPARNKPISQRPCLSTLPGAINYREIYEELDSLKLAVYMPSSYIHGSKLHKYELDDEHFGRMAVAGREMGIQKLMVANLLKRLESSVWSFRMTLTRVHDAMESTLNQIEEYKKYRSSGFKISENQKEFDWDLDDESYFAVGNTLKIDIEDMDWVTWEREIECDKATIELLLDYIKDIDPAHDEKLVTLCKQIKEKIDKPINEGNKKIIIFTAFADTADYLFEHVSKYAKETLGLETAEITGGTGKTTIPLIGSEMNAILSCFSPISKERSVIAKDLEKYNLDILIATDCISEGQNLQDCDYLINYDIHWNPVRIVQRFGRIDRIGSKNDVIQLVNFWPDVELDEYIKLKARVEQRMRIAVMTSTGDDDLINEEEQGDLEYRERQLRQMQEEVIDLEDVSGGVSITDLGLNEFRMDLVGYHDENPNIERTPTGIHAVVEGENPGIIFVLRNVNQSVNIQGKNQLHPFYLVYIGIDGEVICGHLQPKKCLDMMRLLCRGKSEPEKELCKVFNKETKNGRDMRIQAALLQDAVASIIESKEETDVDSFFSVGTTSFLENDIEGLDDFELICFLAVKSC